MGNVTATGAGPVAFLAADGRQVSVPLARIYFDASGDVRAKDPAETDHPGLLAWLQHLVQVGQLAPGTAPPLRRAMFPLSEAIRRLFLGQ